MALGLAFKGFESAFGTRGIAALLIGTAAILAVAEHRTANANYGKHAQLDALIIVAGRFHFRESAAAKPPSAAAWRMKREMARGLVSPSIPVMLAAHRVEGFKDAAISRRKCPQLHGSSRRPIVRFAVIREAIAILRKRRCILCGIV